MNGALASNLKKMISLSEIMSQKLCTHEDYLKSMQSEMAAREVAEKQAREITKLTAAVAAGIKEREKLTKSYFQNNERLRIVKAYNAIFDEKKLDEQKIKDLKGDIVTLREEIKKLKVKCATLSMELGARADDLDSSGASK